MESLQTTADRRPDPTAFAKGDPGSWPTAGAVPSAAEDLGPLLVLAATLDLDDAAAGACLRAEARRVTSGLVAAGRLPSHLLVGSDDPVVVVLRTLASAWQRVAPAGAVPPRLGHGG